VARRRAGAGVVKDKNNYKKSLENRPCTRLPASSLGRGRSPASSWGAAFSDS